MKMDLGGDLVVETATEEDFRYVHRHLRPGDRAEHKFDKEVKSYVDYLPTSMTIRYKGMIVGYAGFFPLNGMSIMSESRFMYYLSTRNVDKFKIAYVRRTPEVFKAIASRLPPWVNDIVAAPMPDEYPMSCKWLERILGFKAIRDFEYMGGKFRLYLKKRKDI